MDAASDATGSDDSTSDAAEEGSEAREAAATDAADGSLSDAPAISDVVISEGGG
jgi:hypothetical protein